MTWFLILGLALLAFSISDTATGWFGALIGYQEGPQIVALGPQNGLSTMQLIIDIVAIVLIYLGLK